MAHAKRALEDNNNNNALHVGDACTSNPITPCQKIPSLPEDSLVNPLKVLPFSFYLLAAFNLTKETAKLDLLGNCLFFDMI